MCGGIRLGGENNGLEFGNPGEIQKVRGRINLMGYIGAKF